MSKPKFVKPLLIGVACTIPVGLVVGLSVNWEHTQFISSVGSSGVKPFIENFGKKYHDINSKFDVTVESGGTAFGIEQVAQGYANLGNATNNPYSMITSQGYLDQWKNKKTFTLGWEGVVVMYSLPADLDKDAVDHIDVVITQDNILKLYAIFSGWYELKNAQWDKQYESLYYYTSQETKQWLASHSEIEKKIKEINITPFVRSGGNTCANSSIAFTYYSNLVDFSEMTEKQQKAFAGGQYGTDGITKETDESNARAWQSFENTNLPGSMVYLTSSFLIEDNLKLMKEKNYKLAKVQYGDTITSLLDDNGNLQLDKLAMTGGYNWYRPIDVMIDLDTQKSKDFLYWIYFGDDKSESPSFSDVYLHGMKEKGAKPLDQQDFTSMLVDGSDVFNRMFGQQASDINLSNTRPTAWKEVYGAIESWKA